MGRQARERKGNYRLCQGIRQIQVSTDILKC
jgi:hypothetical protein